MEKQLKEIIRSVLREEFINELSKNDVHVKEIMKFYDKGTYSTKKAVSIFVSGKTNATRNQILDDLGDMGYNDALEVMDHFKLKLESVNETTLNEYIDDKGVERVGVALPQTEEEPIEESTEPSDIIKDLDKVKNDLIKKADVLIAKKKKLYTNVDIESPISADEKKLNKDITDLFSQIQQLILQKRKIKN